MDRFHSCGNRLGSRLWAAKVAGEPLKKIFNLLTWDRLVFQLILIWIVVGFGRIWIGFCHGNLFVVVAIVGEFAR